MTLNRSVTLIISAAAIGAFVAAAPQAEHTTPQPEQPRIVAADLTRLDGQVRQHDHGFHGRPVALQTSTATLSVRDVATGEVVGPVVSMTGKFDGMMLYPLTDTESVILPFQSHLPYPSDPSIRSTLVIPHADPVYFATPDCSTLTCWIVNNSALFGGNRVYAVASATPDSFISIYASDPNAPESPVTVQSYMMRGNCFHQTQTINLVPVTTFVSLTGRHPQGLRFTIQ